MTGGGGGGPHPAWQGYPEPLGHRGDRPHSPRHPPSGLGVKVGPLNPERTRAGTGVGRLLPRRAGRAGGGQVCGVTNSHTASRGHLPKWPHLPRLPPLGLDLTILQVESLRTPCPEVRAAVPPGEVTLWHLAFPCSPVSREPGQLLSTLEPQWGHSVLTLGTHLRPPCAPGTPSSIRVILRLLWVELCPPRPMSRWSPKPHALGLAPTRKRTGAGP